MSTAEPFMPSPWPSPADRAAEIDADGDVDVLTAAPGEGEATELPETPENTVFRTPTPGEHLSADELDADLHEN